MAADDADDGARPPRNVVLLSTILASARRIVTGKMIEVELEFDVDSPTGADPVDLRNRVPDARRPHRRAEYDARRASCSRSTARSWPAGVPRPAN